MAAAVVIGLDSATGLQTARILAARGVPVIGVARDRSHACCRTRVCREIVFAETAGPALVRALVEIGTALPERAVLFPCTDLSVLAVSRQREDLRPWFHLVLPHPDVVEMLVDKRYFADWAERQGLPVPRARLLRRGADVQAAIEELRFPCILKPAIRTSEWRRHIRQKGFRVASASALRPLFDRCSPWAEALIVQEFVEGGDTCHVTCNCYLTKSGNPAVMFTSRKLRQWPITAGEGCRSEEVRNDEVRDITLRLFQAAGHRGLGYVEFKQDQRTGKYLILEPNIGRPTGRSAQAEASGVELLYSQYCDAIGLPLPDAREQRYTGVKWTYFRRDLQSSFHHWRRGDLTPRDWLRSVRGPTVDALFSWADPVPFWADLGYCARELLVHRRNRSAAIFGDEPVSA